MEGEAGSWGVGGGAILGGGMGGGGGGRGLEGGEGTY